MVWPRITRMKSVAADILHHVSSRLSKDRLRLPVHSLPTPFSVIVRCTNMQANTGRFDSLYFRAAVQLLFGVSSYHSGRFLVYLRSSTQHHMDLSELRGITGLYSFSIE